jgi:hypothetical protein
VYLVLCFDGDLPALWAHGRLRDAGLGPLELVTAASLALAKTWEHRLGVEGVQVKVELEDGRVFHSSQIRGVLNRLASSPQYVIDHAIAEDREYASGESSAFYLSWLNALPRVINRPTPQGLPGSWRHASEWKVLAARAGLNTPPYRQSSASHPEDGFLSLATSGKPVINVIVLRGELYGSAVTSAVGQACRKLAESADTDLLGVDLFDAGNGELMFVHATPFPDLTLGGGELIDGLARALQTDHTR